MTEPVVAAVFEKLGGRGVLGTDVASEADLARLVQRRIPLKVLGHVRHYLSNVEIRTFIIPDRTKRHRLQKKQPLTVDESDRLVRMIRVQALAEDVFGDREKAKRWLREPLGELGNSPPLAVAQTEVGARVVEQILAKIDWGAAA